MTKQEKQELIRMLRNLRTSLDVPPPKDADAVQRMNHFAYLVGKTQVVLDSALITLST